jgi:hypothetical protein
MGFPPDKLLRHYFYKSQQFAEHYISSSVIKIINLSVMCDTEKEKVKIYLLLGARPAR